ncbi:NAD-dependent epimerase/dehydratase family protein [Kitasatospora sp. NPDC002040]|uniref:NAD-dependent epimerase/dehydratase family protein n=1 Tax=Kitasatospora sp. NPDC002040 TaxID=3154661 RepID=UPI0033327B5D
MAGRKTILLTGGTGFVGSRVLELLISGAGPEMPIRVLTHRRCLPFEESAAVRPVIGDLADPGSLYGVCEGVDTVVHLASQIGGDPDSLRRVNEYGTAALLAEAARAGVRRVLQLSTTAVYRDGVHRDLTEYQPDLVPGSETSRTRLAAERAVLAAGGVVIRPHLVYGTGDTWVVPALADLLRRLPHWIDGGRARMSMIAVDDLARPIAALARSPWGPVPGGRVFHASHPEPVGMRELVTLVCAALGRPVPSGDVTLAQARRLLEGAGDAVWDRRLSLLAVDHWYESSRLWRFSGCEPGPGLAARFPDHAPWYRELLRPSAELAGAAG